MRKNGFTLIELLAVIVILAIIALIATPIILGIIKDAKVESEERSVELYASAVRNGIAAYQLRTGKGVAAGSYTKETLPFEVEYDGNVVCESVEIYSNGGVYLNACTVNGGTKTYNHGEQQEVLVNFSDVCTPVTTATTGNVPTGAYNMGDEYTCEVKEGVSYTFFILSKEGNKVNLIMDSNIREDGTPVKDTSDLGRVAWLNDEDYGLAGGEVTDEMLNDEGPCQYGGICVLNTYGPLTAMKHLQKATEGWKTGSLIVSEFEDDANNTHKMAQPMSVPARMPSKAEVNGAGCTGTSGSCPLWMTNYMHANKNYYPNRTAVSEVYGYWTLSSGASGSISAWLVDFYGRALGNSVDNDGYVGVRPVITLSI